MNTKKKILFVLACLWLCFSLYVTQSTYAKYVTNISGSADIGFSIWHIVINEQNILDNNDISNTLTPIWIPSDYISDNVIVPGSEGYIDITLDSTRVSVPFTYTLTATLSETNEIPDLTVYSYSINDTDILEFTDLSNTQVTGNVTPDADSLKIRLFIKWNDNEDTNLTNDIEDTAIAIANGKAKIDINLKCEQIVIE